MPDDGPRFLEDPPPFARAVEEIKRTLPEDRWTAAAAAALARGMDEQLAEQRGEDDQHYWMRVGTHYFGNTESWDDAPYDGPATGMQIDGLAFAVPAPWGPPTH